MAALNMSVKHGHPYETARVNFVTGVTRGRKNTVRISNASSGRRTRPP